MTLPLGAAAIAQARKKGRRPADPVVVSLCGRVGWPNPSVQVSERHDWTFLADLDAIVCVKPDSKLVTETLRDMAPYPRSIVLWDVERKAGMDLWPVWLGKNVREVTGHGPDYRGARLLRWARITWLPLENRRFEAL
jgi:hypothetical protein